MRRILISDELAAVLASIDKDATAAIGKLNQSYVFSGAAFVAVYGASEELLNKIREIPKDKLSYFLNTGEMFLSDILKAEKVEIKE